MWVYTLERLGYIIYFMVDEAQMLYSSGEAYPRRKSGEFWRLVKNVSNNMKRGIRILTLAAFGSGLQYADLWTPVEIPEKLTLNIRDMNFYTDEVYEYVMKWFVGFELLGEDAVQFCAILQLLTGGHVGLCVTVIYELNKKLESYQRSSTELPSGQKWVGMLSMEDKKNGEEDTIFEALLSTCAVCVLHTLNSGELDTLERIMFNPDTPLDKPLIKKCIRGGILDENDEYITFSSPVLWRYFAKIRFGTIKRALYSPTTLHDLVVRVLQTINYDSIRQTLGRSYTTDIPLERAWQMEFYKASFLCSTNTWVTSADVGGLFRSKEFLDFTMHGGKSFWGIELLREGKNLQEHIDRFACGGHYSVLKLSDYCLMDFRRIGLLDNATKTKIAEDMERCVKLYVVCYDTALTHIEVFNTHHRFGFSLLKEDLNFFAKTFPC
ncbi:Crinkler (CRN) family protein [Thraustotheca clavata]|uniref:Crinkler (CRN) family protein n=1 Tax=Thraustotheca clavata TaxID=74557 RepID=A0A1V9YN42_9STRA|nr:Crinkler (CRN) family protein [Thraustotheca clavata]